MNFTFVVSAVRGPFRGEIDADSSRELTEPVMKRALQVILVVTVSAPFASASERHFAYTYESAVLRPGTRELEPWTTFRLGRSAFYSRLDARLEAELGLTDRLQTAFYLNLSSTLSGAADGRVSHTELQGVSSEWKLKLSDPVADRIGAAAYLELTAGPSEVELEGKLILDKRAGRLLGALNLVAEHEWSFEEPQTEREKTFEVDAAGCVFLTPRLTAGLELRSHTVVPPAGETTRSALFFGPTISYAKDDWWVTVSVLPQIRALAGASNGHLDLVEHERVEVRILAGVEF
jgi:hypothetical protein